MKLHCEKCGKFMADVRDASIRNGMIVLCGPCWRLIIRPPADMPDFFEGLFGGRK